MSQNHFTLGFPLKSPSEGKLLAEQLPPMMPDLFQATDKIGRVHYSRFTVLSEKTLLFLGDFDGEFEHLMADLAKLAGPVFDAILQHVADPPPTPVAANVDAFVKWTSAHLVGAVNLYTAYPDVTAKAIKALASAAEVDGGGELHPFLVILPIKSYLHFVTVQLILRARGKGTTKDLTPSARLISRNSYRSRTIRSASLRSMTARSTNTSPTLPRTSDRSSILSSDLPRARRRRHAESTCRSSLTSQRERAALRSDSIKRIRGCRSRTSAR
jgi:hypothetical protein